MVVYFLGHPVGLCIIHSSFLKTAIPANTNRHVMLMQFYVRDRVTLKLVVMVHRRLNGLGLGREHLSTSPLLCLTVRPEWQLGSGERNLLPIYQSSTQHVYIGLRIGVPRI